MLIMPNIVATLLNEWRTAMTPEYWKGVSHHYQHSNGFFAERTCCGKRLGSDSVAFIWKQAYTIAKGEFVAGKMVLVEEDGRYLVDHVISSNKR